MELKELYQLMDRFEKTGLWELAWRRDKETIRLRKGPRSATVVQGPVPVAAPTPAYPAVSSAAPAAGADAVAARAAPGTETISAPLVGTFYRASTPDAAPFVEKGDRVKKGQTLCILEAMKLMNEFQAEYDLEVLAVLAENATMVEFGTPLFEVRKL
jgi:acetyl-CoA carboxylase biotin carboxyl carrier protein